MQSENEALHLKVTDLEVCSWRQNVKITGLPEKIHPTEFVAKLISELLGVDNFSKPLEVDRAHRLGRRISEDDARLPVMVAWIYHFQLKEKMLQLAHQQFPLRYNGKRFTSFLITRRRWWSNARHLIPSAGHSEMQVWGVASSTRHGCGSPVAPWTKFFCPRRMLRLLQRLLNTWILPANMAYFGMWLKLFVYQPGLFCDGLQGMCICMLTYFSHFFYYGIMFVQCYYAKSICILAHLHQVVASLLLVGTCVSWVMCSSELKCFLT